MEYFRFTRFSITPLSIFGGLANIFAAVLILVSPELRWNHLGSLQLFLFNVGEWLLVRYTLTKAGLDWPQKLAQILQNGHFMPCITFFVVGQIMAVAFVTFERIQLVSGTLASINHVVRNPTREKYRLKVIIFMMVALLLDALLSGLITHLRYIVAPFLLLNLVLYGILVAKISRLRTSVHGAVLAIRRRALLYVTVLMVGFICEFIVFFIRGHLLQKHMTIACPVEFPRDTLVVIHLDLLRFVWEALSYFAFDAVPRKLVFATCKRLWRKIRCCQSVNDANNINPPAVIHFVPD